MVVRTTGLVPEATIRVVLGKRSANDPKRMFRNRLLFKLLARRNLAGNDVVDKLVAYALRYCRRHGHPHCNLTGAICLSPASRGG